MGVAAPRPIPPFARLGLRRLGDLAVERRPRTRAVRSTSGCTCTGWRWVPSARSTTHPPRPRAAPRSGARRSRRGSRAPRRSSPDSWPTNWPVSSAPMVAAGTRLAALLESEHGERLRAVVVLVGGAARRWRWSNGSPPAHALDRARRGERPGADRRQRPVRPTPDEVRADEGSQLGLVGNLTASRSASSGGDRPSARPRTSQSTRRPCWCAKAGPSPGLTRYQRAGQDVRRPLLPARSGWNGQRPTTGLWPGQQLRRRRRRRGC